MAKQGVQYVHEHSTLEPGTTYFVQYLGSNHWCLVISGAGWSLVYFGSTAL